MRSLRSSQEIEEELAELDLNIRRLDIEYTQFFRGVVKREPTVLRGKVQKAIIRFANEPPRNSAQKFRYNTLNARFQAFRQRWGRTMREMENGTHHNDRFRAKLEEREREEEAKQLAALDREEQALASSRQERKVGDGAAASPGANPRKKSSAIDALHGALLRAKQKTGESGSGISREKLAQVVKQQTAAIRAKRGQNAKIKFKVVIEGDKAKLKATVS